MNRLAKFLLSFIFFVVLCYGGLVWFVNHEVEKGLNNAVAEVDGLTLNFDGLWVDISDHTMTLTTVDATLPTGEKITADEIVVSAFDERNPVPHFFTAQAKGMTILAADAQRWGVPVTQDLHGEALLDYRYMPEQRAITISTISFDDPKQGKAEFSGTLTELDLNTPRVEKLIGLRIKDAELTYVERSFLDNLIGMVFQTMGMTKAQGYAEVGQEFDAMAKFAAKEGNEQAEKVFAGLKDFVENPGTITIKADPKEPVPYLYFFMGRDTNENIRLLNLSVETKAGEVNNQ